jgi:hypothetical protein
MTELIILVINPLIFQFDLSLALPFDINRKKPAIRVNVLMTDINSSSFRKGVMLLNKEPKYEMSISKKLIRL